MSTWNPDNYQKTLRFAAHAHQGQSIPGIDLPYILHPVLVSMEVIAALPSAPDLDADLALQCALLHDIIEDTTITYEDMQAEFGNNIADGVLALSKNPDLPKDKQLPDSLKRIQQQPQEIWLVKLADRITNLAPPPADWSAAKCRHYRQDAVLIHQTLHQASPYLAQRLLQKIEDYQHYC